MSPSSVAAFLATFLPNIFLPNTANIHVDTFGILALCLGFASGMMPARRWILLTSAACAGCFSLHYAALGALTGTAMCSISVLQSVIAARFIGPDHRAAWVAPLFAASSVLAGVLTLATWAGWPSACAGIGSLFATAARLQGSERTMRLCFLGASLCWLGHNGLVGSVFGLTCDLMTILGLGIALFRASQPHRNALQAPAFS